MSVSKSHPPPAVGSHVVHRLEDSLYVRFNTHTHQNKIKKAFIRHTHTGTYKVKPIHRYVPIKSTYRVHFLEKHVASLLLQFKFLSGKFSVEKSYVFEHCEIRVPFFRSVRKHQLKVSIGSISLNQNRNALIWIPGTKISTEEAVLSGTIEFVEKESEEEEEEEEDKVVAWKIPTNVRPSDWLLSSVEKEGEEKEENIIQTSSTNRRVSSGNVFDPFCT